MIATEVFVDSNWPDYKEKGTTMSTQEWLATVDTRKALVEQLGFMAAWEMSAAEFDSLIRASHPIRARGEAIS